MGRLKKTEIAFLAAAVICLALAVGVRLGASDPGAQVGISAADRSADMEVSDQKNANAGTRPDSKKIDINSADAEMLTLLPGIGPVLAGRIVQYREEHGAFSEISDIMNVAGIGQGTFGKIKDYITAEEIP